VQTVSRWSYDVPISATGINLSAVTYDTTHGLAAPAKPIKGATGVWAAQSGATIAGQAQLVVYNQLAKFADDVFVRLPFVALPAFGTQTHKGQLGGNVKELGTNVVRKVRVYHRPTGRFVAEVLSRSDGNFTAKNSFLNFSDQYQLVAVDDPAPDVFNDLIHSQLVPVTSVPSDNTHYGKDGPA
jgi:hypothetical protein